jgi:hypothetical protein
MQKAPLLPNGAPQTGQVFQPGRLVQCASQSGIFSFRTLQNVAETEGRSRPCALF